MEWTLQTDDAVETALSVYRLETNYLAVPTFVDVAAMLYCYHLTLSV